MKPVLLKKLACITALLLAPVVVQAGGTNAGGDSSTGYVNDPDRSMGQGDMGAQGTPQPGDPAPGAEVDDLVLAKNVKEAIKKDAMLKKLDIGVEASNGQVTLTGDAKDVRWRARALMVANSIKGVRAVQNNLAVGSGKQ